MTAEPFSLDELIPEPLTVTFAGAVYEVRTVAHLGPAEYARFQRLQRRVATALPKLERVDPDPDAGQVIADATDELIGIIIPDLPADARRRLSFERKSSFLQWWQQQHPAPPPGEAGARGPTRPARSRASSSPATTPSAS